MNLSTAEYDALQPVQWPVWDKKQDAKAVQQLFCGAGLAIKMLRQN